MFGPGRISVVRRWLLVVSDNKTLYALVRHLYRAVPVPALISLALLYTLYAVAEYKFSRWYFSLEDVWRPAFPRSWRIVFLSLFVVPAFAFLQLSWLLVYRMLPARHWLRRRYARPQGYNMLSRSEPSSMEERGLLMSPRDEEFDRGFGDVRSPRPLSPFPHQRHPHSFVWSLRFVFWLFVLCMSLWVGLHYQHPGDLRYLRQIERANAHPRRGGYGNKEKIFIGAMFYNNEEVLPYWSESMVKVIRYLGADNVFVSIVESQSGDRSPALLRQLDDKLDAMHVRRRILTQDTAVTKPDKVEGNDRIRYLSGLRNRVLEPLVENGGYDKVLFSNDIFVEPESVLELLHTAEGKYDMACGMDFNHFGLYDMWVLRDKRGRLASDIWPYFFDEEAYEAMKAESPVPVFTCWNGIVAFKADPVLPIHLRSNRTLSKDPLPFALPATHPATHDASLRGPSPALTPPARFRGSVTGECFSSESFLLPYDFRRLFGMQRIFVNPRVVVGYRWQFYVYFKWFMRHPVLKWWIEKVYDGAWMQKSVTVIGDAKQIWQWDGSDCHPWW